MKRGVLDLVLLLVIVPGAFLAWQTGQKRSRLAADYERLSRKTGDLPVADATRVYLKALPTGEPLHFAWHVHLPANYSQPLRHKGGWGVVGSGGPSEFIARVRFREGEAGDLELYTQYGGGSMRMTHGGRPLADLLRGRWDKVLVEQLGNPEMAAIEPDRSAVLLRLTLPGEMQAEAREKLSLGDQERLVPILFEWTLGPETPKPPSAPPGG